jgi:class 3 adenylate cyclase/Tfp pilus assembly protein PilF
MRVFLFISLCLLLSVNVYAQAKKDSLLRIWSDTSLQDTSRLSAAHELVWRVYLYTAPDSARLFAEGQLQLAEKSGLLKQISSAYNNIGVTHHIQGDLKNAIHFYNLSLQTDEKRTRESKSDFKALEGIASSHSNLAILYQQLGDVPLAMQSYFGALQILDSLEQMGHTVSLKIADVQNNIGLAQETQGSTSDAMDWYLRSLKRYEQEPAGSALGNVLTNIGNAKLRLANNAETTMLRDSLSEQGYSHFLRGLEVRKQIGDRRGEANALNNIAYYTQQKGGWAAKVEDRIVLFQEAENYYRQSLIIAEEVNDQLGMAYTRANLAENLIQQNRINEAIEYGESALDVGQEIGNVEAIYRASEKLFKAYKKAGRAVEALNMHELYTQMSDSIRNEENTRSLMRKQYEYDYSKREALLVAEQEKKDAIATVEIKRRKLQRNAFIAGFGMMMLLAIVFFSQRIRISREKDRSENLLLNILPAETAKELKEKGSSDAKLIDQVTVLFTDFKGFTAMSEQLSPKELVKDLHECFSAFDNICEKYGIEKIKTIGDAYMAAGGLPIPSTNNAEKVIRAALEMAAFIEDGKVKKIATNLPFFEVRLGIHTGPVVAGIVGIKKFQYDIWGDTVNTASRMESSGEVGKVNISQNTYDLLKDDAAFTFESRGKVEAKGKGEIEMFFVNLTPS